MWVGGGGRGLSSCLLLSLQWAHCGSWRRPRLLHGASARYAPRAATSSLLATCQRRWILLYAHVRLFTVSGRSESNARGVSASPSTASRRGLSLATLRVCMTLVCANMFLIVSRILATFVCTSLTWTLLLRAKSLPIGATVTPVS